jgi:hypothetical protein
VTKPVEAEERIAKAVMLEDKLRHLTWELKEAVDLSIEVRRESPQDKHETIRLWEEFLGQLFGYIKYKSKESKDNLLAGISLTRLKLF